jgi:ABC-2 type transport system permease protein
VALVILYAFLEGRFSMALGLLFGATFNSISAATAVEGPIIIYILAGIFVGPLGALLGNSPWLRLARVLPTYYIADGVYNATRLAGSAGSNLVDIGVIAGCTVALLAISAWVLRRQSGAAGIL